MLTAPFLFAMNDITQFLINRQSNAFLSVPSPDQETLHQIIQAGMRVPDHAALQPWKFTIAKDAGLQKLSDIFVEAIKVETNDEAKLAKTAKMPFRAPMIIVISTDYKVHEKVPKNEQLITAGCCAHAMQMAATSLGFGAMWRTGDLSTNLHVKQAMGITGDNEIVGFLYIGTPSKQLPIKPQKSYQDKVSYL